MRKYNIKITCNLRFLVHSEWKREMYTKFTRKRIFPKKLSKAWRNTSDCVYNSLTENKRFHQKDTYFVNWISHLWSNEVSIYQLKLHWARCLKCLKQIVPKWKSLWNEQKRRQQCSLTLIYIGNFNRLRWWW